MEAKVTIPALQQMKRDGKKSVGVVAWDYQIAQITDRAGVDIISVGDSRRHQSVGPRQSARSHDGRDARRAARRCAAAPSARSSAATFPSARCRKASTARCAPPSGWSRKAAPTWSSSTARPIFPKRYARSRAPAFRCSRSSASRRRPRCNTAFPTARRTRPARRRPPEMTAKLVEEAKLLEDAGAVAARLHQLRAGRRRRGGEGGQDPGDRRLRRRAVARRPHAHGARRDRLRRRSGSNPRSTTTPTSRGSALDAFTA